MIHYRWYYIGSEPLQVTMLTYFKGNVSYNVTPEHLLDSLTTHSGHLRRKATNSIQKCLPPPDTIVHPAYYFWSVCSNIGLEHATDL